MSLLLLGRLWACMMEATTALPGKMTRLRGPALLLALGGIWLKDVVILMMIVVCCDPYR